MSKPKITKGSGGNVVRGSLQPSMAGKASAVMSHKYSPGADRSARRHPNVKEYNPARQEATALIHRLMERRKK